TEIALDLLDERLTERLTAALAGRSLYGIVHAAWPSFPHGGLMSCPPEVLSHQLLFGADVTLRLARALSTLGDQEAGGALVAIGSSYGTKAPSLPFSPYSLGKGLMEQCMRLLAPELARKRLRINVIAPSFMPVGMNSGSDERRLKLAIAGVPLGRLCQPRTLPMP